MAFSNFASQFLSLFFTHFPAEWRLPNISAQTLSTKLPHKEGPQPGEKESIVWPQNHITSTITHEANTEYEENTVCEGAHCVGGGVYFGEIKVTKPS